MLLKEENDALIDGLEFVYPITQFDDKTFNSNMETLFVKVLGHCADKKEWEKCDVD
jgi:hypothetical protein